MLRALLFFILLTNQYYLAAQIHVELEGEELYRAVVESYKPNFVEVFSEARNLMYTEIYNQGGQVEAIYSGHQSYLPSDEKYPIQYLAKNRQSDGILAEHIYPESKGAIKEYGNAFSDLHNLAPALWAVKNARRNKVFGEVDDSKTDYGYDTAEELSAAITPSNERIQKYTEIYETDNSKGVFEPRESVKGDIARSIFYFYTMYREEALRSDPEYFENMRETMCQWHSQDPADKIEIERSVMKGFVQDGKANPFVMDCTLAIRMYCPDYDSRCTNLTDASAENLYGGKEIEPKLKIYPNPNRGTFSLDISNIAPGNYRMKIFLLSGQLLYSLDEKLDYFNTVNMWNARPGIHIIQLINRDTGRKYSGTFTVIK